MNRRLARLTLVAAAFAALPAPALADEAGTTSLISRPTGLAAMPAGPVNSSWTARFGTSSDGCRTVFVSAADGLSTVDDNRLRNVFVRDACQDETILVSRATGANGAAANGHSQFATISADGKAVAFSSSADNLAPGVSGLHNLYVRRLDTSTTVHASPRATGSGPQDAFLGWPSLNGDGTVVAFSSDSSALVAGDTNGARDIFVRTLSGTPQTRLVSRPHTSATAQADDRSDRPSLDHRAWYVAFDSAATNLVTGDTNGKTDVFVRSLNPSHDYTTLVSRADGIDGALGNGSSTEASFSGDATKVAFSTAATNIFGADANPQRDIVVRTFDGQPVNQLASLASSGQADGLAQLPALDDDGSRVAFAWDAQVQGGGPAEDRIWLRDLAAGTSRIVSRGNGADAQVPAPTQGAASPSVDGDASHVSYTTFDGGLGAPGLYDGDFAAPLLRDMAGETNVLLARPTGSGTAPYAGNGDNESEAGARAVSADGRYVAFASRANGITADDRDDVMNVFRRDTKTGDTVLVSRADGAAGAAGDGDSGNAAISADGRRVAFTSEAGNLGPGAGTRHVYVRDVEAGTTVLASRAAAPADADAFEPAISADGTHVAFATDAGNLGGSPVARSVYVRDLAAGTTELASRADGAAGPVALGQAYAPSLDADGSHVAFESSATNLDGADTDGDLDVYVRDLDAKTTTLASAPSDAFPDSGNAHSASLDADGDAVAFTAQDMGVAGDQVFLQKLTTPRPARVHVSAASDGEPLAGDSDEPSISGDGTRVAFTNWTARAQVYLRDVTSGTTTLVSRASGDGPAGDADSERPALSANGRCVTFTSAARNLDGAYAGDFTQVWRRAVDGPCPQPVAPAGGGDTPVPPAGGEPQAGGEQPVPVVEPIENRPSPGKAKVAVTKLRRRGRTITVSLRCVATVRCTGTLRLAVGRAKLGRALVALAAGRSGTVKVKLGAKARRTLAKARGRKVTVTVTVAGGVPASARLRLK